MRKKPFFSIIVPCYNSEKYITLILECVVKQTFRDYEVIVIDDGSQDDSIMKVNCFREEHKANIHIISQINKGVSEARNTGLRNSNGKYVLFLDSDDLIEYNLLQIVYEHLDGKKYDVIAFKYDRGEYTINKEYGTEEISIINEKKMLCMYLDNKINVCICSLVFKNEFLKTNKIMFTPKCYYAEDIEFIIKSIYRSNEVILINSVLFHYIDRGDSAIKQYSEKRLSGLPVIKGLIGFIDINDQYFNILRNLIRKRYIEEIVWVYLAYVYYGKGNDYGVIKELISENIDGLKEYLSEPDGNNEIKKAIKGLSISPKGYRNYLRLYIKIKSIAKKILFK